MKWNEVEKDGNREVWWVWIEMEWGGMMDCDGIRLNVMKLNGIMGYDGMNLSGKSCNGTELNWIKVYEMEWDGMRVIKLNEIVLLEWNGFPEMEWR